MIGRRQSLDHCAIGWLGFVEPIEKERGTLSAVRVRNDPGVFVGESPGLDRSAAWVLRTGLDYAAVDLSLLLQIAVLSLPGGIGRQSDIEFRDVNLQA
jgi:hypothetical protein